MKSRKLTENEIAILNEQLCKADDWSLIAVREGFSPSTIHNVYFSGNVSLGVYTSEIDVGNGIYKKSGIRNAYIQDCRIADNVYISDVKNLINYDIEENVIIENVGRLQLIGETTFGNGIDIEVLNANGNRKFPMFDRLTAQLAYLMATYRQNPGFNKKLEDIITLYVESKKSSRGLIKRNSRITDSGKIINVWVGESAHISGALCLEEGTISSNRLAPVHIGDGVNARSFIMMSGSTIDSSAIIENSFIGQAVQVGKQFSADNSLLFCNSEFFHGEACNIFAGPFTVTHHKSTLLIAGMVSFFNAGSGSNQSNHMYKLGPIHQGVLERGCKTGSFSYLLWPTRIGAFTVVIGKHLTNFDSADFPFSYILETRGKTVILPGLNYFTAGMERDRNKWFKRDSRTDSEIFDLINFSLLTPFIVGKILKAIMILKELDYQILEDEDYANINGMIIEKTRINKAINDYESILQIYMGDELIKQIEFLGNDINENALRTLFTSTEEPDKTHWVDAAGMIVPINLIKSLFHELGKPGLNSIQQINDRFRQLHDDFENQSWRWCQNVTNQFYPINEDQNLISTLIQIIDNWQTSSEKAIRRILKDAAKEFSPKSRIGYGLNGDEEMRDNEFASIVGTYGENDFIINLNKKLESLPARANKIIPQLNILREWKISGNSDTHSG